MCTSLGSAGLNQLCRSMYEAQRPTPVPPRTARCRELSPTPPQRQRNSKRRKVSSTSEAPRLVSRSRQEACVLLTGLPAELRLRIWAYALGGQTLHVVRKFGKLGHMVCGEGEGCTGCTAPTVELLRGTLQYRARVTEPVAASKPLAEWNMLHLLVTCSQIYSEAYSMLYTHNTFDFISIWSLSFLQRSILPKRFAQIRSVRLTYEFAYSQLQNMKGMPAPRYIPFPTPRSEWDSACNALLALSGLQSLQFRIISHAFLGGESLSQGLVKAFPPRLRKLAVTREGFRIMVPTGRWRDAIDLEYVERGLNEKGVKCTVAWEAVAPPAD
ncbi:hypothetical protein BDV95DRAFT_580976 [Massariosphaeria phaeospora]|uniref:DUF7730 domain-containing protein n=1 Tax=Massariosphaeria phaeospora TaxID=100035 RepID=A0A7C8I4L2_9PLEO|nr:hypothetical protein BDV95DRAFT_580976 [Massariosphaeria phaeospora]